MKVLSVVCARAGSKGLENKCIAKIGSKMVIEYSIEYSLSLGKSVTTVVSTDISEVIQYCIDKNIKYITRSSQLCDDNSKIDDTLADAIRKLKQEIKYCALVYGNIPTRYPVLFHESFKFLEQNEDYDLALSMQNVEKHHPDWMHDYNEDVLAPQKVVPYRRQLLAQKMYHDGHTFIFRAGKFLDRYKNILSYDKNISRSVYGKKIKPMINDKLIIDIDTHRDITMAKCLLSAQTL